MSATETIGKIIDASEQRDAIHVAVEPAIAGHTLRPGDHVGFRPDGAAEQSDEPIGIVDPFLDTNVRKGQRFWLFVYPRQITSLRHVWSHPRFPDSPVEPPNETDCQRQARRWIESFASCYNSTYTDVMSHAKAYLEHEEYWNEGERFEGEHVPQEFWDNYQVVTRTIVPPGKQRNFFSCSC